MNFLQMDYLSYVSRLSLSFADRLFPLMLVYRKQQAHIQKFSDAAKFNSKKFHRYYSRRFQL